MGGVELSPRTWGWRLNGRLRPQPVLRTPWRGQPGGLRWFVISNSATGHGSFSITPQITIAICDNGMTFTRDALRKYTWVGDCTTG